MATQTVISTGNPSFQRWVEENKDFYTVSFKNVSHGIKYFTVTIFFHKYIKCKVMTAILICNFKFYILQMNCSSDKQETEMLRQQLREVQQTLSAFRKHMGDRRSPSARSTTSRCTVRSTGTSVWSPSSQHSNISSPSGSINDIATTFSFSCQLSDSDYTLSSRGDMTQPDGCSDSSSCSQSNADTMDYDHNCTSTADMTQTFVSDYASMMMFGESRQADMESDSNHSQRYSDNSRFPSSSSSSSGSDNMAAMSSFSCQLSDSDYTFSSRGDTTLPEPTDMTETFVSNCVSKLMYGDVSDCSLESHEDDTSSNKSKGESSQDSDASAFMELPLCRRPVTHKSSKHRSMAKHLKQVGKQIRKHGIHNLMDTLAII